VTLGGSTPWLTMIGDSFTLYLDTGRGTAPFTYKWRFNGQALAGQTNSSLMLDKIQPEQAGVYEVTVRNPAGAGNATRNILVSAPLPLAWTASKEDLQLYGEVIDLEADGAGNLFAGGTIWGTNSSNVVIAMYAPDGTEKWTNAFPGHAHSINLDTATNLYVTAEDRGMVLVVKSARDGKLLWSYSQATAQTGAKPLFALAPKGGCYLAAADFIGGINRFVVTRLDANGVFQWRTVLTNGLEPNYFWDMKAVGQSGVALAGRTQTGAFLTKIDELGRISWQSIARTNGNTLFRHLAVAPDGSLIVEGEDNSGSRGIVLLERFGSDGQRLWSKSFPQESMAGLSGVALDSRTNILAVWASSGWFNAIKLDLNGTTLWRAQCPGYFYNGEMCVDSADNLFFAGYTWFMGPGDYKLLKIDPLGRFLSFSHREQEALRSFGVRTIECGPDGMVYVGGGWKFDILAYRSAGSPTKLSLPAERIRAETIGFELSGDPAFSYNIEKSTNLRNWTAWTNVVNLSGKVPLQQIPTGPALFLRATRNP
jgi:hypothetical protein